NLLLLSVDNNSNDYLKDNLSSISVSVEENNGVFNDLINTTKKALVLLEEQKLT
ncbi:4326_t:CDS:1, partial [Racocetra persica]